MNTFNKYLEPWLLQEDLGETKEQFPWKSTPAEVQTLIEKVFYCASMYYGLFPLLLIHLLPLLMNGAWRSVLLYLVSVMKTPHYLCLNVGYACVIVAYPG